MIETKKPRKELRRMSDKQRAKLAAEGHASPRSTLRSSPSPSKPRGTKQGMPIRHSKPKRKPRSADEALRIYGPDEFRDWLHTRSCAVCGAGGVEQAHAKGDGMARKADWTLTLPLCRARFDYEGCHRQLHRVGVRTFETDRGVSLLALAELTQKRYAASRARTGETG